MDIGRCCGTSGRQSDRMPSRLGRRRVLTLPGTESSLYLRTDSECRVEVEEIALFFTVYLLEPRKSQDSFGLGQDGEEIGSGSKQVFQHVIVLSA